MRNSLQQREKLLKPASKTYYYDKFDDNAVIA